MWRRRRPGEGGTLQQIDAPQARETRRALGGLPPDRPEVSRHSDHLQELAAARRRGATDRLMQNSGKTCGITQSTHWWTCHGGTLKIRMFHSTD